MIAADMPQFGPSPMGAMPRLVRDSIEVRECDSLDLLLERLTFDLERRNHNLARRPGTALRIARNVNDS